MTRWFVEAPTPEYEARALAAVAFDGSRDDSKAEIAWDKLVEVAHRLGARVVCGTSEDGVDLPYGWNGAVLRIKPEGNPLKRFADLAHDLGHLQGARPDRRGLVEFGLGPGYATDGPIAPADIRAVARAGKLEDHVACLMGAYWARAMGVSAIVESRAIFTIAPNAREWGSDHARETCVGALRVAERWGLIDPLTDTPLVRMRTSEDDPVLPRLRFQPQWCREYPGAAADAARPGPG
jgi:hypothetical protein